MDREKIINLMKSQTKLLRSKYHVKNIGVFGSVARGEETEKSDVDIIVEFESPIGFFDFIKMENELSGILGRKVDLVTKKSVKPAVKDSILREIIYV